MADEMKSDAAFPTGAQSFPQQPSGTTILMTNVPFASQTFIALPSSGKLWVAYEYSGQPAKRVYIWHQGGATEPVSPGFHEYQVSQGDAIIYELSSPLNAIKLGWAYL